MPFHQHRGGHFLWFLISNIFLNPLFRSSAFLSQHLKNTSIHSASAPYSNEHPFDLFCAFPQKANKSECFEHLPVGYILSPSIRSTGSPSACALPIGPSELTVCADLGLLFGHSKSFYQLYIGLYLPCVYIIAYSNGFCNWQNSRN